MIKCIRCDNDQLTSHTPWTEMGKPVKERISSYSCYKCGTRWTASDIDPPTPEINGVAKKQDRPKTGKDVAS